MKAIILAAGEGSRLRPLTQDRPKCLIKLRNKTILDYQVEVLRNCGVEDIIAVTGYKHEALSFLPLRCYYNENYQRTNMVHSLFCAENEFDDDILVSYGDILFEKRVVDVLLAAKWDFSVIVDQGWRDLWNLRMANPLKDAETLKVDSQCNIIEIGKKTDSYSNIQGQYIGLFKISKPALPAVRDFYHRLDRHADYDGQDYSRMYMTSFIHSVANQLMKVKAVFIRHGWLEVDTLDDLQRYESMGPEKDYLFRFF